MRPYWSEQIYEEWMRTVQADYPDITREDLEYTRDQMDRTLPDACAEEYRRLIEELSLPDSLTAWRLPKAVYPVNYGNQSTVS